MSYISEWTYTKITIVAHIYFHVLRDQVGNNMNNIANCIFCFAKKSNQPEDGS